MNTAEMIERTRQRLALVYNRTLFDLNKLDDHALTEMEHEAEHYRGHRDYNDRVAGEIVSVECRVILDERRGK